MRQDDAIITNTAAFWSQKKKYRYAIINFATCWKEKKKWENLELKDLFIHRFL